MDEGRFVRGATGLPARPSQASRQVSDSPGGGDAEIDHLVQQLREAGGHSSGNHGQDREKVARFIEAQRERIKKTFGDRDVEFRVVIEGGKPKVKVRAKKP
jgi:phytoene dehydrogenase-like protein